MAAHALAQSAREYGRGVAGGLLFSLPVLYTMEVWWTGFIASPERLLAALGVTFGLLLLYNFYAGLHADASLLEVWIDSVEELGLGLVLAALVLWLTGQLGTGQSLDELLGKVVLEAMAVSIGVSIGTAQLGAADETSQGMATRAAQDAHTLGAHLALSLCGAFIVAANVAPTEEVVQIASETTLVRLLLVVLLSLALCALVLFASGFRGARSEHRARIVLRDTVLAYAVALLASALLLWFFGRFDGLQPVSSLAHVVTLGLPAALGASAGRLLLNT